MTRIGLVGIGFMGMIHFLAARNVKGAKVVALCSRDEKKRAGDWRGIKGNFGPEGEVMDLAGVKAYATIDELLADPAIDLVDICSPTHQHAEMAIKALEAGKHVLVEKPIALPMEVADRMVAASRKAGKLLMVAHVLPFVPEFAFAAAAIRDGRYGKLLGGHFRRIISKPDWSADICNDALTGGPAIDLHIHDTHFIRLIAGMPKRVFATGCVENDAVSYLTANYLYGPGGPAITCSSGALAMKGRPFVHGFEIYLEKATLMLESGVLPLTVLHADGRSEKPTFAGGDDATAAFTLELQAAVDGVKAGKESDLLGGQLARDALVLCHKECESVKTGAIVNVGS